MGESQGSYCVIQGNFVMRLPVEARFMRQFVPEPNSGCWLWTGTTSQGGYARLWISGTFFAQAHRFSYELHCGPIPPGLQLDHLCRVRCCVNPHHLEPVKQRDNILRGEGITAKEARRTHCIKGHPLFGENVYSMPSRPWWRACRICRTLKNKAKWQRILAARAK